MKEAESAESKEKSTFRFLFFELWSFLYSNVPNFHVNLIIFDQIFCVEFRCFACMDVFFMHGYTRKSGQIYMQDAELAELSGKSDLYILSYGYFYF